MDIKSCEFKAIAKCYEILIKHLLEENNFDDLEPVLKQSIIEADISFMCVYKRYNEQKKKACSYIKNKRKTNKNYARTPYVKVKDRLKQEE